MAKKILIVDDEPHIIQTVQSRLQASGYEVIGALTGKDGLAKAQTEQPDLILLDIILPDIDGGVIAQKLKEKPLTADIPIVFLTCIVQEREVNSKHDIGGNIFIPKPFDSKELLSVIQGIIG